MFNNDTNAKRGVEMGNKEDRRVTRSKQLLKKSLIDLMKKKPMSEITVKEITALAEVNRGTFYSHYQDIYDMVEKIENEIFEELDKVIIYRGSEDINTRLQRIYRELFTYLAENAEMCTVLLGENGNISFLKRLKTVIKGKILANWAELFNEGKSDYFEAYSTFIVGGCVSLIQEWLEQGLVEKPEQMAILSYNIVARGSEILK